MTFEQIRAELAAKAAPFRAEKLQPLRTLEGACNHIATSAARLDQSIRLMSEERVAQDLIDLRKAMAEFDPALLDAQTAIRDLMKSELLQDPKQGAKP